MAAFPGPYQIGDFPPTAPLTRAASKMSIASLVQPYQPENINANSSQFETHTTGREGGRGGGREQWTNHVGTLSNESTTSLDQFLRLLTRNLVLRSTGKRYIEAVEMNPRSISLDPFEAVERSESGEVTAFEFERRDGGDDFGRESFAVGGDERSARV